MWKDFEQKIRGSMYGTAVQKVTAQEALLKNDKSLSPEQRRYLRNEISKERRSIERAKRVSPKKASPLKLTQVPITDGSMYKESLRKLQDSSKKLQYADMPEAPMAEALRSLFKQESAKPRPSYSSAVHVGASPIYPPNLNMDTN